MTSPQTSKILILTSCIGGGHVFRDLAIGRQLRQWGHEIVFASGGAAYQMLAAEAVTVERIAGMSFPAHLGTASFLRLYLEVIWSELKQLFDLRRLMKQHRPALVVLDEYFFLADYCRALGVPVVFMSDFVGVPQLPLLRSPLRALLERFFDWWISGWLPRRVNRWVFIGDPQHIPSEAWRERARQAGLAFVEPITKLQYSAPPSREAARKELAFEPDARVVTVAVGCTEVGGYLLEAANAAAPLLRQKFPNLRLELVCGMSIASESLAARAQPGVRVHGYLRHLEALFVASDVALVQCGLTTVTECLMLGVPTIVIPLANHWEQQNTARYVQEVAGCPCISAEKVTPEVLAEALSRALNDSARPRALYQGDGHVEAAKLIQEVLLLTQRERITPGGGPAGQRRATVSGPSRMSSELGAADSAR